MPGRFLPRALGLVIGDGTGFTGDPNNGPLTVIAGDERPNIMTASPVDSSLVARFTNPLGGAWTITRVSVSADKKGNARLYVGDVNPANLVSVTSHGDGDENDLVNPYYIPNGSAFNVVWDNGTPANCTARVEYSGQ